MFVSVVLCLYFVSNGTECCTFRKFNHQQERSKSNRTATAGKKKKKIPFDCLWKERKFWSRNISTVETGGKAVKSPKEVEKQTLHGHERVTQTLAQ